MKIVYLTWGETPRCYGVYGSQVVALLQKLSETNRKNSVYLLSGLPIIHSGLVRERFGYLKQLRNLKNVFKKGHFRFIFIYLPQNIVRPNIVKFKILHLMSAYKLHKNIKDISPDILHCRSYHSAWTALTCREKYNHSYKIIFDARDLWPEEMAFFNRYNEDSHSYKFLKGIEKKLLSGCDFTIGTSEKMTDHFRNLGANKAVTIHTAANVDQLKVSRQDIAQRIKSKTFNFCYVGHLGIGSWHDTHQLLNLFIELQKHIPYSNLTIVTTANWKPIKEEIRKRKITNVKFSKTNNNTELSKILSEQDFGILSYHIPEGNINKLLADKLFSVKASEYFAAGLPMICNKHAGDISNVIDRCDFGVTYDPLKLNEINIEKILKLKDEEYRANIAAFAANNLSLDAVSKKYMNLYSLCSTK